MIVIARIIAFIMLISGNAHADAPVITLSQAILLAEQNNQELQAAKEAQMQQKARYLRSWSLYLPKINLDATGTFNFPASRTSSLGAQNRQQAALYNNLASLMEISGDPGLAADASTMRDTASRLISARTNSSRTNPKAAFDLKLSITQPIFNLESIMAIKSSSLENKRAVFIYQRARAKTGYDVAKAYFLAIKAQRTIDIANNRLARAKKQKQLLAKKQQAGLIRALDVARLQVEVVAAQKDLLRGENDVNNAMANLGVLIGIGDRFAVDEFAEINNLDMASQVRDDLNAQLLAVKVAEQNKRQIYAGFAPIISFVGQGKYSYNTSETTVDHVTGAILLQASFSLFDFDRFARLRENYAKIREERAKLADLENRITVDMSNKVAQIELQKKMLKSAKETVALQRNIYDDLQESLQAGLVDSLDLIDSNQKLADAEVGVSNANIDLQLASLELAFVGGWSLK